MRRRTGLALVLVLTIILALVLIATPFVLSMIKQERVATTEKAERQATYGSEGVRNFGVATLLGGLDANERQGTTGVWNTPYSDVESEFSIDLRDSRLASLKILDPHGKIWGVTAEDEQAKIDIRTAPERVLQTLRTYVDTRVIDLKDVTTMYAGRNARWIFPQSIRGTGPYPPSPSGVLVDDATHYGRDATVRFVGPGSSALITRVRRNFLISDGWPVIETVDPAPPGATMVEVEARHPVNLNTARRETLAALLEGIRIDVGLQQRDEISRQEALDLAAQIAGRTIESWQEFAQFLEQSNVGTPLDRLAVLLNFMDPTNADLDGTGTMPGCFVSHDTATLQTRAMMNTPAGTPVSGVGFREVLDVGPPVPTTWTLESQHDFDAFFRAAAAGSQAYAATPPIPMTSFRGYPWGGRIVTFPNAPPNPSDKTRSVQAYIQLDHARDMRGVGQYLNFRDHFDAEIEGRALNGGPQTYPWRSAFARNPEPPSPTALLNAPDIAAGGTEFWVRFDAIAPIVLFDVQESPMANRITLEHTGTDLLLTVTDATLPDPNPKGIDKGLAEIRM
ncbi:MAG: hypothetical protein HYY16_07365, partial [Planctomycetes bacterium]|nr:hypothetical protein [Planctomycetota bacterium]